MQQQWAEDTSDTGRGPEECLPPGDTAHVSSGLACLAIVAQRLGVPLDPGLLGRHPAGAGEPDMATLASVAAGAGFRAQALGVDWRHLRALGRALPAIVALRDGRRLVLTQLGGHGDAPDVELVDPDAPSRPLVMLRAAFELAWTGDVLLVKPRARPALDERPFGWAAGLLSGASARRLWRDLALATCGLVALAIAPPLLARVLVGDVLGGAAAHTFLFVLIALGLVLLFEAVFTALQNRLAARLGGEIVSRLEDTVLARGLASVAGAGLPHGATRHLGGAATLEASAARVVRAGTDIAAAAALLPVLIAINGAMAMLLLAGVALGGLGLACCALRHARASASCDAAAADLDAILAETVRRRDAIFTLGLGAWQRRRWDGLLARAMRHRRAEAGTLATVDIAAGFVAAALVGGPLVLGVALSLDGPHALAAGDLFVFALASWRVAAVLRGATGALRALAALRNAMAAWREAMGRPVEADTARPVTATPLGQLSVHRVSFTFPAAAEPALEEVSFTLPAGHVLGVIGRSGAGASTLMSLLGRQLEPDDGLIKLDGVDLRAIPRQHLRRAVAHVARDAVLFPGTLRDNLCALLPEAGDEVIGHALRLAGVEHLVRALPAGLATLLDPAALPCSEGERQALLIARVLMARPAVVLLDGATDAFGEDGEARLVERLRAAGLTVIVATDRLATLAVVDAGLVLGRAPTASGERADAPRDAPARELEALATAMRARDAHALALPAAEAA